MVNNSVNRRSIQPSTSLSSVRDSCLCRSNGARIFISLFAITLFLHAVQAQRGSGNLPGILHENAKFDETDLAAIQQGEPAVTLLPAHHRKEVAVYGMVRVQASAESFLQSFRDTMATRSNAAILEIGRFGSAPTIDDLNTLTMASGDIEDLKRCVVGNCELKLSTRMIDRFQKTVDWQSSDYAGQATRLYKVMLLDYVRDYLKRGDQALLEYTDKSNTVSLLDGQRLLLSSLPAFFHQSMQNGNSFRAVENAIVWSKIKFGLKPVLAINHITIFKSEQEVGPQILILSKQIYADHYFDASIALTGFARHPAGQGSYLFYENHSLADGLQGLFSNMKRKLIQHQAQDGLKDVLRGTKARLDARAINESEEGRSPQISSNWKRLRTLNKILLLGLFCITVLVILGLASYQRKAAIPRGTHAS